MKGVGYFSLGVLFIVRSALADIRIRFFRPWLSTIVTLTRLGSQRRLVWRCEWETLCPVIGRFPVIGHTLDINTLRFPLVGPDRWPPSNP